MRSLLSFHRTAIINFIIVNFLPNFPLTIFAMTTTINIIQFGLAGEM